MKNLKILSLLLCMIGLSACQAMETLRGDFDDLTAGNFNAAVLAGNGTDALLESPCPQVDIVDDLSSLSDFVNPKKANKSQLISRVDLKSAESTCRLASKSAIVDLKLIFNGKLGPKGKEKSTDKPFFSYPYFVAVTGPNGKIMAKEIFAASMQYNANENEHAYFEKLRQVIPIRSKDQANRYRVLIGFQVTPDQLIYNREHMVPIDDEKKTEKVEAAN